MNGLTLEFDVAVSMRDGTVLRADVYRPALRTGPWPVLLQRTPYDKRHVSQVALNIDTLSAVRRGYIVIHQDTRGRFASEGEWLPWAHEREDGYDTVEWAAQIEGSNGRVAMVGSSYTGATQWAAAVMSPPHLVAIAPQVTWSDPEDGLMFRGGATELGLNVYWSLKQALDDLPRRGLPEDVLASSLAHVVHDFDRALEETNWQLPAGNLPALADREMRDTGIRRALQDADTVDECRVVGHHDKVDVPTLNMGGWFDVFLQGTIDNYLAMRERGLPARLVIGPWDHGTFHGQSGGLTGEVNFGLASSVPPVSRDGSYTDVQLSWFDHWLKDAPATALHEPGADIFVMGINQWRHESVWPPERAVETDLFLHPDGGLKQAPVSQWREATGFEYDPADPVLTRGGNHLMSALVGRGPVDQAPVEVRPDVLTFTSDVLEHDVEITGRVRAHLCVETDAPSTDWVVRLCDVDAEGVSRNVMDGILRTVGNEPSKPRAHLVDLWSTSHVFQGGHRIRVQVTSSNFPRWDRNMGSVHTLTATEGRAANQRVLHDRTHASRITLPVMPSANR